MYKKIALGKKAGGFQPSDLFEFIKLKGGNLGMLRFSTREVLGGMFGVWVEEVSLEFYKPVVNGDGLGGVGCVLGLC